MIRKTMLLAFLLPFCSGVATQISTGQTPDIARAMQDTYRKWQSAIDNATRLIHLREEEARERIRMMRSAAFQGDLPQALSAFIEFRAAYERLKTDYLYRGQCYGAAGKWDKTIADCTEVIRLDPTDSVAYSRRASARDYRHELDKALVDCNRALLLDPKNAEAYISRGDIWLQKGKYDQAIADCDKGLLLDPKVAKGHLIRGLVWSAMGENDKAFADWEKALAIDPNDYRLLNNVGVSFWVKAEEQDLQANKAEAAGDSELAAACRKKSVSLKNEAKAKWNRGVAVFPAASDIHSNLGYAYSEANDLDSAERYLTNAVWLMPDSARPRNNLGRVLQRRSQKCEAEAREAEAKGKTDPAEAAKVQPLRGEAKTKLDAAAREFEAAVALEPTLQEAHLNLGEVYFSRHDFDKAEAQFRAVVKLQSDREKDQDKIRNFSRAHAELANVAWARKNVDEAVRELQKALKLNPQNANAMQLLATARFQQEDYREGEKCLASLLSMLPPAKRRDAAEQFGASFMSTGKAKEAVRAWTFLAWTFATSNESRLLDAKAALDMAQRAVDLTKRQDPKALDTLAAAQAADGQYKNAIQTAQTAIGLANSHGKKTLADAISQRLLLYQQEKSYRCDPSSSDRP